MISGRAVSREVIVSQEIGASGRKMYIKMRVTVTSRFCSGGYIAMQVSAVDRVYELDGVWHKSLNSYRGTATWSGMRQVKISLTRLRMTPWGWVSNRTLQISRRDIATQACRYARSDLIICRIHYANSRYAGVLLHKTKYHLQRYGIRGRSLQIITLFLFPMAEHSQCVMQFK